MDFVTARLTGRITATQHSMFMSQLCDNRTLGLTGYDDELVRMAGVDSEKLPNLIGIEDEVGTMMPSIAADLGLPSGVVVYPGFNDTAALGLAAGVHRPGRAGLAIGTTSVLVDSVGEKNTDLDHEVLSMPALSAEDYLVFAENGNGGRVVEYVMRQLVHSNDVLANHQTDEPFARFDNALAQSEPGVGGVLFLPWLAGSLAPNANANMRGGFINMSLEASRVDLVRAAAEGVAHNLAWLLPHVETFTGNCIDALAFVGGAARSTEWGQILSDILNRPIRCAIEPEMAIARTAARHALVRAGALAPDQVVVETGQVHEPQLANRAMYELHQEQFEAAFEALRPISETLTAFHAPK
jgi:xylulokinase